MALLREFLPPPLGGAIVVDTTAAFCLQRTPNSFKKTLLTGPFMATIFIVIAQPPNDTCIARAWSCFYDSSVAQSLSYVGCHNHSLRIFVASNLDPRDFATSVSILGPTLSCTMDDAAWSFLHNGARVFLIRLVGSCSRSLTTQSS